MASGFNARKAAQVVAYLANNAPDARLNVVKTIKLVYLADRDSFEHFGFPILDEDRVSMRLGPVNSTTYDYVKGEIEDQNWSELLQDRENHEISVTEKGKLCDWDELSEADIQCLDRTWQNFGHMSHWQLVDWTHDPKNVPEWKNPNGGSLPIRVSEILTSLGVENADAHSQVIEDHRRINRLIANI